MTSLTADQLDLLQSARDGLLMWGGSVAIDRLQRDVELPLVLRLVERHAVGTYRLTEIGARVLTAAGER